jgi:intein/homing endonuclease
MSNLCVAGDTKIKVRITTNIETKGNTTHTTRLPPLDIEIQQLQELIKEGLSLNLVEVLSYNIDEDSSKAVDFNKITAFAQTSPKAKVMRITDEESGKSIVVTPEHKVFTKNRGYVMAKDLTETDELVIN